MFDISRKGVRRHYLVVYITRLLAEVAVSRARPAFIRNIVRNILPPSWERSTFKVTKRLTYRGFAFQPGNLESAYIPGMSVSKCVAWPTGTFGHSRNSRMTDLTKCSLETYPRRSIVYLNLKKNRTNWIKEIFLFFVSNFRKNVSMFCRFDFSTNVHDTFNELWWRKKVETRVSYFAKLITRN